MLGVSLSGQSALNADLIDQLREADKSVMTKPFETQLTTVYQKQADQKKLVTALDSFRATVSAFSSGSSYLKRSVSVSSDSVSVSANDGVDIQNMTLQVTQMARNSVAQSAKGFANENDAVNLGTSPLTLKIIRKGDQDAFDNEETSTLKSLDIEIKSGMTLSELRDAINEASDGTLSATILNVGGSDPYSLIVKSAKTGEQEELSFAWSDEIGGDIDLDDAINPNSNVFKFNPVQEAQDAQFTYNGMTIRRTTNTISDLISGVTIELKKEDTNVANVSISRDLSSLSQQMQAFVDSYNELTTYLSEITKYDTETSERGSFQGDSRINSIRGDINKILFANNEDGKNIMDLSRTSLDIEGNESSAFAFSLAENGSLTFDQRTFEYALEKDPEGIERLLRGVTDVTGATAVGKSVPTSTTDVDFYLGDVYINGVAIGDFSYKASDSAAQNAQALMAAINKKTSETGVSARIGGLGDNVVLYNATGDTIEVKGTRAEEAGLTTGSFSGTTTTKDGIFTKLDSYVDKLNGYWEDATMALIDRQLTSDVTSLTDSIQKALDRINAKYEVMTAQFASYNALISKYEASFTAIQQMIEQAANPKS
jgi:flagellar hook-associated protein 2